MTAIKGYATGNYDCECSVCGCRFDGDKRAIHCLDCAVQLVVEENEALKEMIDRMKCCSNCSHDRPGIYLNNCFVVGEEVEYCHDVGYLNWELKQ